MIGWRRPRQPPAGRCAYVGRSAALRRLHAAIVDYTALTSAPPITSVVEMPGAWR